MKTKAKNIIRISVTYIAITWLALVAFMHVYFHGGHISEKDNQLGVMIVIALFISVISRLINGSWTAIILLVIADLSLFILTIEEVIANGLSEAMKNIVIEPGVTLIIVGYIILLFDWRVRFKKHYKTNRQGHI